MISIDLGVLEEFDTDKNEFIYHKGGIVRFEYSLLAIYNWEAKWKKPFLKGDHSDEEALDFYFEMALDPFDPKFMTMDIIKQLKAYVEDPQTATIFTTPEGVNKGGPKKAKTHTAEELYALMISANVPIEFETRNLNRLFTMLKIIDTYNKPPKKMSQQDILKQNADLNAQRKAMMKSKG